MKGGKTLRLSFESLKTNGAVIELLKFSVLVLSLSKHTNRVFRNLSDRCSHTGFVDEGLSGIVDSPPLATFCG